MVGVIWLCNAGGVQHQYQYQRQRQRQHPHPHAQHILKLFNRKFNPVQLHSDVLVLNTLQVNQIL